MNFVSPFQPEKNLQSVQILQMFTNYIQYFNFEFYKLLNKLYKMNQVNKNILWFRSENHRFYSERHLCEMIIGQLLNQPIS